MKMKLLLEVWINNVQEEEEEEEEEGGGGGREREEIKTIYIYFFTHLHRRKKPFDLWDTKDIR